MLIDTDTLTALLDTHYDVWPLDAYDRALLTDQLIDALPDGHPDVELARSGMWRGTLADWLDVGPRLVQRVPLVRVELTDRNPDPCEWHLCNVCTSDNVLPESWKSHHGEKFSKSDTLELALADASRRAIVWARSKAKEMA